MPRLVPITTLSAAILLFSGCAEQAPPVPAIDLSAAASKGREIFLRRSVPTCATCHALAEAGSIAAVGPNLDELGAELDRQRIVKAVSGGVMPAQSAVLSAEQIDEVASYLLEATAASRSPSRESDPD